MMNVGYVRTSIVRKCLLGCLHGGGRLRVDWDEGAVAELEPMCPDQGQHLEAVLAGWTAGDLSKFLFDRDDWALLASGFACL